MTLEDSEQQAAAAGESSADATSEAAVLDEALEAMQRAQTDPTLDQAEDGSAGASGAPTGANTQASEGSGAMQDVREAVAGAENATGGGDSEQLNRELNDSLARFDGALLGERERIQARAEETGDGSAQAESVAMLDPTAAGEDATEGNYGSVQEGRAAAGSGGPGTQGDTSSGGGMSVGGGTGRKGDYEHTAAANTVPPDIPDGTDDDVVARQIREAAMKEKDPELRAKLWEEYRKYVNAAKRKS